MKRSDIPDDLVLELAARWEAAPSTQPGVVAALIRCGIPPKLARAKVRHLVDRRLLEYGVSENYAWPRRWR